MNLLDKLETHFTVYIATTLKINLCKNVHIDCKNKIKKNSHKIKQTNLKQNQVTNDELWKLKHKFCDKIIENWFGV